MPLPSALPSLPDEIARHVLTGAELARRKRNSPGAFLPTGVEPLDRLLGGGLPRGGLVELSAPRSSGRHSLGLSALAAHTSTGEPAALVDLGSHLDPRLAEDEGVDLSRLLWIRPRRLKEALSAAEIALSAGLPLVVLDLGLTIPRHGRFREEAPWLRVSRAAAAHEAALLVLTPFRLALAAATAVVCASSARPAWLPARAGQVPLLAGLSATLTLEKRRGERPGERALFTRAFPDLLPALAPAATRDTRDTRTDAPVPASAPARKALPALRRAMA